MKKILYFITLNLFIVSCQSNNSSDQSPSENDKKPATVTLKPEQLYGEWRNVSMIITTAHNTPNSAVEEYKEENWEKDLKIKPIRTYYNADGTYISEYRDLDNIIFNTTSGTWKTKQDSVVLNQIKPEKRSAAYHVKFQSENTATFSALLDWTDNGRKDDLYVGKQQRVSDQ